MAGSPADPGDAEAHIFLQLRALASDHRSDAMPLWQPWQPWVVGDGFVQRTYGKLYFFNFLYSSLTNIAIEIVDLS